MKERKFKTTARGALVGSGVFTLYYGFRAYREDHLWIFVFSFFFAALISIYLSNKTIEFIKKKIVNNKIVFKKGEKLKYLVYSLIVGNILLIGFFVVFVLFLFERPSNLMDDFFKKITYVADIFFGFWTGILFIVSLFQYTWIHLWEKKNKTLLIESVE